MIELREALNNNHFFRGLTALLVFTLTFGNFFSFFINYNTAYAQVSNFNKQINYQGKLAGSTGIAVANGNYNIRFKLYNVATGGSALWTETWCYSTDSGATCTGSGTDNRVAVTSGIFSTLLGSTTALNSVDFNQTLYLGVEIGGSSATPAWDGEMSPRKKLGSVPSAFEAERLNGVKANQFFRNDIANSTSTATTSLYVQQSGAGNIMSLIGQGGIAALIAQSNGFIGFGTSTPGAKLSVASGNAIIDGFTKSSYFIATSTTASVFPYASTTNLSISKLFDNSNSLGSNGSILQSNGSTASWVATSTLGFAASSQIGTGVQGQISFYNANGINLTATSAITIAQNGNVGVGTTTPGTKFSVAGNGAFNGNVLATNFTATGTVIAPSVRDASSNVGFDQTNAGQLFVGGSKNWFTMDPVNGMRVMAGNNTIYNFTVATAGDVFARGNVGIGTTTPAAKLGVAGGAYIGGNLTATGTLNVSGATTLASSLSGILWGTNGVVSSVSTSSLGLASSAALSSLTSSLTNGYDARWNGTSFVNSILRDNGTVAGINATSSSYSFNVQSGSGISPFNVASSTGTSLFTVLGNGNVGVGTNAPISKLNVSGGGIRVDSNSLAVDISDAVYPGVQIGLINNQSDTNIAAYDNSVDKYFYGTNVGTDGITINAGSGLVGIGTASPTEKLTIEGGNIALTTDNSIITGSVGLTLRETGDQYGDVSLSLQNRTGMNGALFTNSSIDLVDFAFLPSSGIQQNIRYEHRGGATFGANNSGGEFQIGTAGTPNIVIGASTTAIMNGSFSIGTTSPVSKFTVSGNSYFGGHITATGSINALSLNVSAGVNALNVSANSVFSPVYANSGDIDIVASGGQTRFSTDLGNETVAFNVPVYLNKKLYDSAGSEGASGYVLKSTGTSTLWVATSTLGFATASSLGSYVPYTGATTGLNLGSQTLTTTGNTSLVNASTTQVTVSNKLFVGSSQFNIDSAGSINNSGSITGQPYVDIGLQSSSLGGQLRLNAQNGNLIFMTGTGTGGEVGRFSQAGNFGIGTSTPGAKLSVASGNAIIDGFTKSSYFIATSTTASVFPYASTTNLSISKLFDNSNSPGLDGSVLLSKGSVASWVATSTLGFAAASQIGTGVQGQIPFYNANGSNLTATSAITIAQNGNVGVGTTSPSSRLSINGVGNTSATYAINTADSLNGSYFRVRDDGKVFIGSTDITNSGSKLNVAGDIYTNSNVVAGGLLSNNFSSISGGDLRLGSWDKNYVFITNNISNNTIPQYFGIGTTTPKARLFVQGDSGSATSTFAVASSSGVVNFNVNSDGGVGIGTTTPAAKLGVAGSAYIGGNLTATGSVTNLGVGADSTINFGAQSAYIAQRSTLVYIGAEGLDTVVVSKNNGLAMQRGGLWIQNNTGDFKLGSSLDANISRLSAGKLAIGNGTASDVTGTLIAGNIGIGTTTPGAKLSVGSGNAIIDGFTTSSYFIATSTTASVFPYASTTALTVSGKLFDSVNSGGLNGYILKSTGSATQWVATSTLGFASASQIGTGVQGQIPFYNANGSNLTATSAITIAQNGNVGIGSSTPISTLSVVGNASFGNGAISATGPSAFAAGYASGAGNSISATSQGSIALGNSQGYTITSSGRGALAGGDASGGNITSTGYGSFAWGNNVNATGHFSTAFGVGFTNSTASTFQVGYSSTPTLTVNSTSVGIGTTTPGAKLSVGSGNAIVDGFVTSSYFNATSSTATSTLAGGLSVAGSSGLTVLQNGKVGVGTTTPLFPLAVAGAANITGKLYINNNGSSTGSGSTGSIQLGDGTITKSFGSNYTFDSNISVSGNISANDGSSGTPGFNFRNETSTGIFRPGSGIIGFSASGVGEIARFNGANFGIGTTTPGAKLSVASGNAIIDGFTTSSYFNATSSTATSTLAGGLSVAGSSGLTVLQNGKVGIGITTPSDKLDVNGSIRLEPQGASTKAYSITANQMASDNRLSFIPTNGTDGRYWFDSLSGGSSGISFANVGTEQAYFGTFSSAMNLVTYQNQPFKFLMSTTGTVSNFTGVMTLAQSRKVGIGQDTPINTLDINGNLSIGSAYSGVSAAPTDGMIVQGNVGIGTTSPYSKLSVAGQVVAQNYIATSTTASIFPNASTTHLTIGGELFDGSSSPGSNGYVLKSTGSAIQWVATSTLGFASASQIGTGVQGQIPFYNANGSNLTATSAITIAQNGNVGIGTTTTNYGLNVAGNTLFNSSVLVNSSIYLNTNNPIYFDSDQDHFSSIRSDAANSSGYGAYANLYAANSASGAKHIFIDGEDPGAGITSLLVPAIGSRLGVGTSSPTSELSILGSSYITGNGIFMGNIGAGTTTPGAKLSVSSGNAIIDGFTTSSYFNATSSTATSTLAGDLITRNLVIGNNATNIKVSNNSFAYGSTTNGSNGGITATGTGSMSGGYLTSNSSSPVYIKSSGNGSFSSGYINAYNSSANITSSGNGAFAIGGINVSYSAADITSSGIGSFAGGYLSGVGSNLASGNGSFAFGSGVSATGTLSTAFGSGFTNNIANSFMVGYGSIPTLTVTATGVGIGTTSPGTKFSVAGNGAFNGTVLATNFTATGTVVNSGGVTTLSNATSNRIEFGSNGVAAPGASSAGLKLKLFGSNGAMATSDYGLGIEPSNMWFNTNGGFKWYLNAAASPIMNLASTGDLSITGSLSSANISQKSFSVTVPGTVSDATEFATVTNTNFSSNVEIWFTVHDAGYAQSKRYIVPVQYNATNGVWQKALPISSTGAYGGNDAEIDVKVSGQVATFRVRRVGGATAGTAKITLAIGGDTSGTTVAAASTGYTGQTVTANYAPTSLTMNNGKTGINNDVPTAYLDVIGTTEQLRLGYSTTTYLSTTIGSTGVATFNAIGTSPSFIFNGANFGIGTTTPGAKLSVGSGNAIIDGFTKSSYFNATSSTATSTLAGGLSVAGSSGLNVLQNGNVGIGVTSPQTKLDVNGDIRAGGTGKYVIHDITNTTGDFGSIYGTYGGASSAMIFHVGTDQDFAIQPPISFSSGISFAGVNDSNTVNTPIEFRASAFDFTQGNVGINDNTPDSTLSIVGPGITTAREGGFKLENNAIINFPQTVIGGMYGSPLAGVGGAGDTALYTDLGYSQSAVYLSSYDDNMGLMYGVSSTDGASSNYFAGNVGIGNNIPSAPLEIGGNGVNGLLRITEVVGGAHNDIYTYPDDAFLALESFGHGISLNPAGAGNVTINSTYGASTLSVLGNVGIGSYYNTVGRSSGLLVSGNVGIGTNLTYNDSAGGYYSTVINSTSTGAALALSNNLISGGTDGVNLDFKHSQNSGGTPTGVDTSTPSARISAIKLGAYTFGSGPTLNGGLAFFTENANVLGEKMRIDNNGSVGIGTTTPGAKLSVGSGNAIVDGFVTSSYFSATSSTATSTFNGGLTIGANSFISPSGQVSFAGGTTTIQSSGIIKYKNGPYIDPTQIIGSNNNDLVLYAPDYLRLSAGYAIDFNSSVVNFTAGTTINPGASGIIQFGDGNHQWIGNSGNQSIFREYSGTFRFQDSQYSNKELLTITGGASVKPTLGLGTTTPGARFAIQANSTETNPYLVLIASSTPTSTTTLFSILNNGNVGVGTTTPSALLSVSGSSAAGDLLVNNTSSAGSISLATLVAPSATADTYFSVGRSLSSGNTALIGHSTSGGGKYAFLTTYGRPASDFVVNSTGNVGIGTSSPATLLSVTGTSTLQNVIPAGPYTGNMSTYSLGASTTRWSSVWAQNVNIGTSTWSLAQNSGRLGIFNSPNGTGTETFTILNNGNVGIGTTSPSYKLTLSGNGYINGNLINNGTLQVGNGNTGSLQVGDGTINKTGGSGFYFNSDINAGNVYASGNVTSSSDMGSTNAGLFAEYDITSYSGSIYASNGDICSSSYCLNSVSDRRLKKDVAPMGNVMDRVMALNPVSFKWDDLYLSTHSKLIGATSTKIGFIAQDVRNIFPEVVAGAEGENSYLGVDYDKMVSILTKAIQEQQGEIIELNNLASTTVSAVASIRTDIDTSEIKDSDLCFINSGICGDGTGELALNNINVTESGVAEEYPVADSVEEGDIVTVSDSMVSYSYDGGNNSNSLGKLVKAKKGEGLIGVVSIKSGIKVGSNIEGALVKPIALSGRVPVKVSLSNGDIKVGDYITSGDVAGVGMKATESGNVIGMALESFSGSSSDTRNIMVFMNIGYQKINGVEDTDLTTKIAGVFNNIKEWTLDKITAKTGEFANLKTDTLEVNEGIKIKDQLTGEFYCVSINDGQWQKVKGDCKTTTVVTTPNTDDNLISSNGSNTNGTSTNSGQTASTGSTTTVTSEGVITSSGSSTNTSSTAQADTTNSGSSNSGSTNTDTTTTDTTNTNSSGDITVPATVTPVDTSGSSNTSTDSSGTTSSGADSSSSGADSGSTSGSTDSGSGASSGSSDTSGGVI